MADYHFVYKDLEGTTTEWDDLQRRYGNLPPKPPAFKPPPFTPADVDDEDARPVSAAQIDSLAPDELEELDGEIDDDRFLEEYRKKRLAELREAARVARFGAVAPIAGSDFVREVSQAPQDTWVVVFLYKNGIQDCEILQNCLDELAERYPATKFVKIVSTECIPNYPDQNVPTLLVYNSGAIKGTFVGLRQFGGRKCTAESVALALCQSDPVLRDSENGSDSSTVINGVRKKFVEKVIARHEDEYGYDSDE